MGQKEMQLKLSMVGAYVCKDQRCEREKVVSLMMRKWGLIGNPNPLILRRCQSLRYLLVKYSALVGGHVPILLQASFGVSRFWDKRWTPSLEDNFYFKLFDIRCFWLIQFE